MKQPLEILWLGPRSEGMTGGAKVTDNVIRFLQQDGEHFVYEDDLFPSLKKHHKELVYASLVHLIAGMRADKSSILLWDYSQRFYMILVSLFGYLFGRPMVVQIFGMYFGRKQKWKDIIDKWVTRLTVDLSNKVIVNSKYTEKVLIDIGINPGKITYLPPTMDEERIIHLPGCKHWHDKRRNDSATFLFVGRFVPVKGFDLLLDALVPLQHDNRWNLLVVADTKDLSGDYGNELQTRLLVFGDKIKLLGRIDVLADFIDVLNKTDCMIVPSRLETVGLVIWEAHMAGIPVVAFSVGGIPFEIDEGVNGMLVDDVAMMTDVLSKLLDNPELLNSLHNGTTIRTKERADWTPRKLATCYRDVLRSVRTATTGI